LESEFSEHHLLVVKKIKLHTTPCIINCLQTTCKTDTFIDYLIKENYIRNYYEGRIKKNFYLITGISNSVNSAISKPRKQVCKDKENVLLPPNI
jgi:hypothetical protein